MTLRWSKTILNPPLDPSYRGPVEYEGEVGMGDYPWISQVINESRMFRKIYDTLVVRSVDKAKAQPPPPPLSALEGEVRGGRGGGVFLISPPLSNFIRLFGYIKLFGVQGILGM